MCLLSITAADGPDCTCRGTYIKRGTSIRTSEWVMNLNPFWSMSANTSRKVKLDTLNCSVSNTAVNSLLSNLCGKANNFKLDSKDILQWLKACVRCVQMYASLWEPLWNLMDMAVICALQTWTWDPFQSLYRPIMVLDMRMTCKDSSKVLRDRMFWPWHCSVEMSVCLHYERLQITQCAPVSFVSLGSIISNVCMFAEKSEETKLIDWYHGVVTFLSQWIRIPNQCHQNSVNVKVTRL